MRKVACVLFFVLVVALAGCQSPFETRTYQLGSKPKAACEVICQITTAELEKLREDATNDTSTGANSPSPKIFEEEGIVVVRTTPRAHRRIAVALQLLRNQSPQQFYISPCDQLYGQRK